eukprot:SM000102S09188  [mRNA]  locus=s102:162935:168409:+ [translate_table: standard]
MDVTRAVEASGDVRLQAKFRQAMAVVERTLALYSFARVAFSFNGGKDSTVLLHLLRAGYAASEQTLGDPAALNDFGRGRLVHRIRTIFFESPDAFPEINAFTLATAREYNLELDVLRLDFKAGLEVLLREKPIKAIFLGTRLSDPNAVGQEVFAPSSAGWPPFMRVNPILNWSYRDIWAFLLACRAPYCELYDHGYTSIGNVHDTLPNEALRIMAANADLSAISSLPPDANAALSIKPQYRPAYLLRDGRLERAGRLKAKKAASGHAVVANGDAQLRDPALLDSDSGPALTAAVVAVGDQILRGDVQDAGAQYLCHELHSLGWDVAHRSVLRNDEDAVAEEVQRASSSNDMVSALVLLHSRTLNLDLTLDPRWKLELVFVTGGVGLTYCDVTIAGVAKAFGVRLAADEESQEDLRNHLGDRCTDAHLKLAEFPEGITKLFRCDGVVRPLMQCRNVLVLGGATLHELELQWSCLLGYPDSPVLRPLPFQSAKLRVSVLEDIIVLPLRQLHISFPELSTSCCWEDSDSSAKMTFSLVVFLKGKVLYLSIKHLLNMAGRVEAAVDALRQQLPPGTVDRIS